MSLEFYFRRCEMKEFKNNIKYKSIMLILLILLTLLFYWYFDIGNKAPLGTLKMSLGVPDNVFILRTQYFP